MRHFAMVALAGALAVSVAGQGTNGRGVGVKLRIAGQSGETQLYTESHALVIGVGRYANGWPVLRGVAGDVTAVESSLVAAGFSVQTLLDPSKSRLYDTLSAFIARRAQQENARILVYYAGHGHTEKMIGGEMGYLVPVDAPLPQADRAGFEEHSISMDEIAALARRIRSKHALFVFDSCFSGTIFEVRSAGVPPAISELTTRPVRQFITAGGADQSVPDQSIFRRKFVDALEGEADRNTDGYVTGTELGSYLHEKVTNYSERAQTPQYGKMRNPDLDKGDFVFQVSRSKALDVPMEPPATADLELWRSVRDSNDATQLRIYLTRYPKGTYADVAEAKLRLLAQPEKKEPVAVTDFLSFGELRRGDKLDDAIRIFGQPTFRNASRAEWKGRLTVWADPDHGQRVYLIIATDRLPLPGDAKRDLFGKTFGEVASALGVVDIQKKDRSRYAEYGRLSYDDSKPSAELRIGCTGTLSCKKISFVMLQWFDDGESEHCSFCGMMDAAVQLVASR